MKKRAPTRSRARACRSHTAARRPCVPHHLNSKFRKKPANFEKLESWSFGMGFVSMSAGSSVPLIFVARVGRHSRLEIDARLRHHVFSEEICTQRPARSRASLDALETACTRARSVPKVRLDLRAQLQRRTHKSTKLGITHTNLQRMQTRL